MDDIESAMEQAFNEWLSTWDLSNMTLKDIYEAGFRHGHDHVKQEEKQ
jgi:hypothetical protein